MFAKKFGHLALSVLILGSCAALPSSAQVSQFGSDAGGNVFTAPPGRGGDAPGFTAGGGGGRRGGRMRKMMHAQQKQSGIPNFKQLRAIPSLTVEQRQKIREIHQGQKGQAGPLMEELKKMRESAGGDKTKLSQDPAMREKVLELRQKMRSMRESTWNQTKAILTANQLKELEMMRKGELTPATFNDGQNQAGRGMGRRGKRGQWGQKNGGAQGTSMESSAPVPGEITPFQ